MKLLELKKKKMCMLLWFGYLIKALVELAIISLFIF